MMNATMDCLRLLKKEAENYHGDQTARAEVEEFRDIHAQQLEYLGAEPRSLEEPVARGTVSEV
jgi:hypothetical protein